MKIIHLACFVFSFNYPVPQNLGEDLNKTLALLVEGE